MNFSFLTCNIGIISHFLNSINDIVCVYCWTQNPAWSRPPGNDRLKICQQSKRWKYKFLLSLAAYLGQVPPSQAYANPETTFNHHIQSFMKLALRELGLGNMPLNLGTLCYSKEGYPDPMGTGGQGPLSWLYWCPPGSAFFSHSSLLLSSGRRPFGWYMVLSKPWSIPSTKQD